MSEPSKQIYAGLQIEEDLPFNQSEFGGLLEKPIDDNEQYK